LTTLAAANAILIARPNASTKEPPCVPRSLADSRGSLSTSTGARSAKRVQSSCEQARKLAAFLFVVVVVLDEVVLGVVAIWSSAASSLSKAAVMAPDPTRRSNSYLEH
jgi:hypothetical protein